MPLIPDAATPEGLRIYAIGDVHGCFEQMADMLGRIEEDLAKRPPEDWRIIFLGDYVDRGPDSAACLGLLQELMSDERVHGLFGNHEEIFLDFIEDPEAPSLTTWLTYGGIETLASYGVSCIEADAANAYGRAALRERLLEKMPRDHVDLLWRLPRLLRYGDYAFAHAGVRPGRGLSAQSDRDLSWIRQPFLSSDEDFGAVVVHGHTPVDAITMRPNRIGVDTGAVYGRVLSCVVLEGRQRHALETGGLRELTLA